MNQKGPDDTAGTVGGGFNTPPSRRHASDPTPTPESRQAHFHNSSISAQTKKRRRRNTVMDVRSMLNPPSGANANINQNTDAGGLKTPQRAASLAYPPGLVQQQSSPISLSRTASLPTGVRWSEREESLSVSPKTMPSAMPPPSHANSIAHPYFGQHVPASPEVVHVGRQQQQPMLHIQHHSPVLQQQHHSPSQLFHSPSQHHSYPPVSSQQIPPSPTSHLQQGHQLTPQRVSPSPTISQSAQLSPLEHHRRQQSYSQTLTQIYNPTNNTTTTHTATSTPTTMSKGLATATPSPVMSRKRSLSQTTSEQDSMPQPAAKKRRYAEIPAWARREKDGYHFELKRTEPVVKREQSQPRAIRPGNGNPHATAANSTPVAARPSPQTQGMLDLEPSLDNVPAYDDFGRVVGNWLWEHVVMAPDYGPETHIEIEAKIGTLISPTSQHERYQTGVLSEAILCPPQRPEHKPRFESLMSMQQHKLLNEYLNRTAVMAKEPGRAPVDYAHVREIDTFYELPHQFLTQLHPAIQALYTSPARGEKPRRPPRVRVTTDQKTKAVKAVIIKTRLADLEISCPSNSFDYRISISLETKYPHPYDILPEHLEKGISTARAKDRLSYTHQRFQVDLTQVTQLADRASKSHELEVEMDAGVLREEGRKVQQGEENVYERLVGVFLANVRVINRAAEVVT